MSLGAGLDSSLDCGTRTWDWNVGLDFQEELEPGTGMEKWLNIKRLVV